MSSLRTFVQILVERAGAPLPDEAISAIVGEYAESPKHPEMRLTWKWGSVHSGRRVPGWGAYVPDDFAIVMKRSRGASPEDFVLTLLHELEHYNQHVRMADELPRGATKQEIVDAWTESYGGALNTSSYDDNMYEVSAEAFAQAELENALQIAGITPSWPNG